MRECCEVLVTGYELTPEDEVVLECVRLSVEALDEVMDAVAEIKNRRQFAS